MRGLGWVLGLLLLGLLSTAGRGDEAVPLEKSTEAPALQKQVEALLTAWVRQDPAAMQKVWSPKADQWEAFRQAQQRFFDGSEKLGVDGLRMRGTVADGNALIRVITQRQWRSPITWETTVEPMVWELYWEKEGGDWRLWEWVDCHYRLGVEFIRAGTDEARAVVWKKDPEAAAATVVHQFRGSVDAFVARGDWDGAFKASDLEQHAAKLLGEPREIGLALLTRGQIHYARSEGEAADRVWSEAERTLEQAGEPSLAALARTNRAMALEPLGRYTEALALMEPAVRTLQAGKDPIRAAQARLNRGVLLFRLSRYEEARADLKAALDTYRAAGFVWGATLAATNLASIDEAIGAYEQAEDILRSCLAVAREMRQGSEELRLSNNLAQVERDLGRPRQAEITAGDALKTAESRGDRAAAAMLKNTLGQIRQDLGDYGAAIALVEEVRQAYREQKSSGGEAVALQNLGVLYDLTGRPDEALSSYEAALKLANEIGDRRNGIITQLGMANSLRAKGDTRRAIDTLVAAQQAAFKMADLATLTAATMNISRTLERLGERALALKMATAAREMAQEAKDRRREAGTTYLIADLQASDGKYAEATTNLREALRLAAETGDVDTEMHAQWSLGGVFQKQKKWPEAIAAYKEGARLLESLRERTREQSLQTSFLAQWSAYYHQLAGAYLAGGNPEEAFRTSERVRGRSLVDLLHKGKTDLTRSLSADERGQEQQLRLSLDAVSSEVESARAVTTDQQLAQQEKLKKTRSALEEYRRQMFLRHQYLQLQRGEFAPISLQALGKGLFARNPGLCVLSYLVAGNETLVFTLTGSLKPGEPARLAIFHVPTTQTELQDQMDQFRAACAQPGGAYKSLGQKLYAQLVSPAEKLLAGKTQLVIVPDSAMPPLPFQALVDGQGRHLVERFGISYTPSVTALTAMAELKDRRAKAEKPATPLVSVGRPQFTNEADLPATEAEAKRIAALAGPNAKTLLGKDATEERVRTEISNARFVHLATHGKLNEAAPMYSGLALTRGPKDDGVLEARELMDLDLKAEMVVLSACETGLGKQVRGEGVLGLTWALFVAGTPTSVVSQWQVEDTSTGALMAGFYKALLQPAKGAVAPTKAEALRRAQLALMQDGKHAHPYYWAPFVVVGDWR